MQLNFIANADVPSSSGRTLQVLDPSDGQPFDDIQRSNAADIDSAVRAARDCFEGVWHKVSAADRGRLLYKLSQKIAEHVDELALIEQRDCGKPVKQARADAVALVRYFEFYAGACDKLHGETIPYQDGYSVFTWREPHGVTGHIIPLELSDADLRTQRGRRPGGRQCVRGEAGRRRLPLADPRGSAGGRSRLSGRRAQHRDGLRP